MLYPHGHAEPSPGKFDGSVVTTHCLFQKLFLYTAAYVDEFFPNSPLIVSYRDCYILGKTPNSVMYNNHVQDIEIGQRSVTSHFHPSLYRSAATIVIFLVKNPHLDSSVIIILIIMM